ncbi:hypothetical protein [Herbaspirillum sp. SJZ107]|uniref:hypothetical protein n=1 Tax=Herbaspirillum sp. SJZ107 TaxID=2572881 RepID=UPI001151E3B3|nr:hypothetical protein [Herbaspirillum sp. SJZ107]TQK10711.1 hypothetical protein FBX97_0634 [Herbaspirillum sp. SJZ107]
MNESLLTSISKNDRYFLAILGIFVLGLLLLSYKDLSDWIKNRFLPSYVVYLIGAGLLGQIQNMTGIRRRRYLAARNQPHTGTWAWIFWSIVVLHFVWFGTWLAILIHMGLLR